MWQRGLLDNRLCGCGKALLECETWRVYDGGDHEIVTATVLGVQASGDPGLPPLIFYRSKFEQLNRGHWPNAGQPVEPTREGMS